MSLLMTVLLTTIHQVVTVRERKVRDVASNTGFIEYRLELSAAAPEVTEATSADLSITADPVPALTLRWRSTKESKFRRKR